MGLHTKFTTATAAIGRVCAAGSKWLRFVWFHIGMFARCSLTIFDALDLVAVGAKDLVIIRTSLDSLGHESIQRVTILFSLSSSIAMNVIYLKRTRIGEPAPSANAPQQFEDRSPRTLMTLALSRRVPCLQMDWKRDPNLPRTITWL